MDIGARYVGQSIARVEDDRLLTGHGRYVGDVQLPRMLHAVFVRSPLAHALVREIDSQRARAVPGVVAVLTAGDLDIKPLQNQMPQPGYLRPVFGALADDRVRYAGDPIAVVIAESRYAAEDARDEVEVDYEPLDPVATIQQALDPATPPIFPDVESNVLYAEERVFGDPDAAFADARVVRSFLRPQRVAQVPMEGRGGIADYDPGTGELTYHAAHQSPHNLRLNLARFLGHPMDRLRNCSVDR
jgi:carbon-monoxide dehydrogenase large subunit